MDEFNVRLEIRESGAFPTLNGVFFGLAFFFFFTATDFNQLSKSNPGASSFGHSQIQCSVSNLAVVTLELGTKLFVLFSTSSSSVSELEVADFLGLEGESRLLGVNCSVDWGI